MRPVVMSVAAAAVFLGWSTGSAAQPAAAYPGKPVRLVIPFSPGGAADMVGRMVAQKLGESLGHNFVVENRGGGGTAIGSDMVAKAAADGYALLLITPSFTINASLARLPFDPIRDFAPITLIASTPLIMVAHPSLPARSVKELIALAKSRPNEINFASAGSGSPTHLGMELLRASGARMTHIPYKGAAPALSDLLGGHVQVMLTSIIAAQPHIRSGRLRALGVTSAKRSAAMPEVPAIAETVRGYEVVNWWGLVAPAGTPGAIVRKLQAEVSRIVQLPEIGQRFSAEGAEPVASQPDEFGAMLKTEISKWAKVIKDIGVRPD